MDGGGTMGGMAAAPGADPRRVLWRNVGANVAGEAAWGFGMAAVAPATVLITYLQRHGAGEATASAIAAIEGGYGLLMVAGPYVFRSHRARKRQILGWHFYTLLPALYLMGALVAWGPAQGGAPLIVAVLLLAALFYGSLGAVAGVWNDWFAHLFDERVRGTVSGVMWACTASAATLGGILATGMLARLPADSVYGWLFLLGSVACTISIILFYLVVDPAEAASDDPVPPRGRELVARMATSLRTPAVRALLLARVLGGAAFAIVPFLALHFTAPAGGSLPAGTVVGCGVGITIGTALAALAFGRLGDRRGHRGSLLAGLALAAVGAALAASVPGLVGCATAYACLGLAAGAWLGAGYLVHETTPHDSRLAHLIACSIVQAAAGLLVPVLWGVVAVTAGLPALFAIAAAAAFLGLVWALWRVPEPRTAKAM